MRHPLIISKDATVIDMVLAVAAAVGVTPAISCEAGVVRRQWRHAGVVIIGADAASFVAGLGLPHRLGVFLCGAQAAEVMQWSVPLDASVLVLPEHSGFLSSVLGSALHDDERAEVIHVISGSGGVGGSTLAAALAVCATTGARWGPDRGGPVADPGPGWERGAFFGFGRGRAERPPGHGRADRPPSQGCAELSPSGAREAGHPPPRGAGGREPALGPPAAVHGPALSTPRRAAPGWERGAFFGFARGRAERPPGQSRAEPAPPGARDAGHPPPRGVGGREPALGRGRVAVVETDWCGGGLDVLFGVESEPGWRWSDLRSATGYIGDLSDHLPSFESIDIVAANPVAPARPRASEGGVELASVAPHEGAVHAVISSLRRTHRLVIVDAGTTPIEASIAASSTLLVVGPSVRDVLAARSRIEAFDLRDALVVARTSAWGVAPHVIEDTLGLPVIGTLPHARHIARGAVDGQPPGLRRGRYRHACFEILKAVNHV